jgi:small-conductance mechanosensitive channel
MRRALAALALAAALGGCASWSWPFGRGAAMLAEADRMARDGDFSGAVQQYDVYLANYADAWAAPRARESRDTLAATLAARAEAARLRQEVARLREDLARRETDLVRVRQEAERLRSDLERLKQIDLKLERK